MAPSKSPADLNDGERADPLLPEPPPESIGSGNSGGSTTAIKSRSPTRPLRALTVLGLVVLCLLVLWHARENNNNNNNNNNNRNENPVHPSPRRIRHLASLGSSFAAGPGIPPQTDRYAGRSGNNYAALLSRRVRANELADLAVGGATLLNLVLRPQRVGGRVFAPQVDDLSGEADLVLVLGGGNDLDYIGRLMRDHGSGSSSDVVGFSLNAERLVWELEGYDYSASALETAEALARRYESVLDAVHDAARNATVLVVEYLTLLGADFKPGVHAPFGDESAEEHRARAEMLHNGTVRAVEGREDWCYLVEVARLSWDHGIGAEEPWVNDYRGISGSFVGASYHPNAVGMRAVERMIFRKLVELDLVDDDEDDDGEL